MASKNFDLGTLDLADIIGDISEDYLKEIDEEVEEILEEVGKETVKTLKRTSPDGERKTKKYKNGWKYEVTSKPLNKSLVVYNTNAHLTHLLEKGHAKANQYGKYAGRTRAFPHIKPAMDEAEKMVTLKLEKIIKE